MRLRWIISGVLLSWMAVASARGPLPAPVPTFRLHQLPMTGVRWAGPIGSLAVSPSPGTEILAASRSGGLFRSDGGETWTQVDSLLPTDLSNVMWAPSFGLDTVFVTTRDDFRSEARGLNSSGVWRSLDRGATWRQVLRLSSGSPAPGVNCDTRPMAYGMSVDPIGPRLFVATKCGIWSSNRSGSSFSLARGTAMSASPWQNRFYDVQVLLSGEVVALGEAGLFFLDPATASFTRAAAPGGLNFFDLGSDGDYRNAISAAGASDLGGNAFVVVRSADSGGALVAPAILYSRSGGRVWQSVPGPGPGISSFRGACGGSPFIRVDPAGIPDNVNFYYGDGCFLYKAGPLAVPPGGDFGPLLVGLTWSRFTLAHEDTHDFVPFGSLDAMVATDGGIEVCRRDNSAPCGETIGPEDGLNALQVTGLGGQRIADFDGLFSNPEYHLYASTWHTSIWSSVDGMPWEFGDSAEGMELEMPRITADRATSQIAYDRYAFTCPECQIRLSGALFSDAVDFPHAPDSLRPGFFIPPAGAGYAYAQISSGTPPFAVQVAVDVRRGSIPAWTQVDTIRDCGPTGGGLCVEPTVLGNAQFGAFLSPGNLNPALYSVVAGQRLNPDKTIVVQANARLAFLANFIAQVGGEATVTPSRMTYPEMALAGGGQVALGFNPAGGVRRAVYAVDPSSAGHLLAPDVTSSQMVESFDGGDHWHPRPDLTSLVTTNGRFTFTLRNSSSVEDAWPFVSAISFSPDDPNMVVLGTMNNGIFFSRDAGGHWSFVPGSGRIPSITKFHWKSANSLIVATAGRGVWEVAIELRHPLVRLPAACPDCSFLTLAGLAPSARAEDTTAQRKNRPQVPTLLVMDGRVIGAESMQDGSIRVIVTPGSSRVWFAPSQVRFPGEIVEQSKGGFPGLPEADQLEQQGFSIRGLSFDGGAVTGIVYGKGEAKLPPIDFVPLAKLPGTLTLGLNERPNLTLSGPELRGLSIPEGAKLTVRGQNFNAGVAVNLLIDDGVVVTGLCDQGGRFELSFPVNVARGSHTLLVTQKQAQGELRVAMALSVVHSDPGEEK